MVRLLLIGSCSLVLSACGQSGVDDQVASGTSSVAEVAKAKEKATAVYFEPELVPTVYRFAKISNGAYFYTGSEEEVQVILNSYPDFRYEGPAFERDTSGQGQPVYRFANTINGGYFFTGSDVEKEIVRRDYPHMRFEGSSFSVAPVAAADAKPVYRLANLQNGAYLFTTSAAERDYAVSLGSWRSEGSTFKAPKGSSLSDRRWLVGKQIGPLASGLSGADGENFYKSVVLDDGSVLAVFVTQFSDGQVLYTSKGQKNSAGDLIWGAPVYIDVQSNGVPLNFYDPGYFNPKLLDVKASPNGHILVTWSTSITCNNLTIRPFSDCFNVAYASYSPATGLWTYAKELTIEGVEKPALTNTTINNNGDIAFNWVAWRRNSNGSTYSLNAVSWRAGGQSALQTKVFDDFYVGKSILTLDNAGGLLFVRETARDNTTDILAYRGNRVNGFQNAVAIDQRFNAASLINVVTTPAGKTAVVYKQINGTNNNSLWIAESSVAIPAWSLLDFGFEGPTDLQGFAAENEIIRFASQNWCWQFYTDGNLWRFVDMPSEACNNTPKAYNRFGDYLAVEAVAGSPRWMSYDARRNKVIAALITSNSQAATGYVNGLIQTTSNWVNGSPSLGANGNGVYLRYGNYDTLPTNLAPAGDGRPSVRNLWGFTFK
jgi:Repeat of unknown function (DUF5648)